MKFPYDNLYSYARQSETIRYMYAYQAQYNRKFNSREVDACEHQSNEGKSIFDVEHSKKKMNDVIN